MNWEEVDGGAVEEDGGFAMADIGVKVKLGFWVVRIGGDRDRNFRDF